MKHFIVSLGLTAFLISLLPITSAHAGMITQFQSFNFTTPISTGNGFAIDAGFQYFDPFDPALGSLSEVDVEIDGSLNVVAMLPSSQVCTIACVP